MKLHSRYHVVNQAHREAAEAVARIFDQIELTPAEAALFHTESLKILMYYQIREERHPNDPHKRGDEA